LLERKYNEMMNSFEIEDSDSLSSLIIICKADLKMNQALDNGDLDGFQKLARASESTRKSAKFTAAQNKEDKSENIDCIGNLVAFCEREGGFIPRFKVLAPNDKVDKTLEDFKTYTYNLITSDLGIGKMIEDQFKKIEIQKQIEEDEELAVMANPDKTAADSIQGRELRDKDFEDYFKRIMKVKEEDGGLV
jgi:hypothetical protein